MAEFYCSGIQCEDYLSECVDSLLNQDVPSELYEIILYDDGSTDGSAADSAEIWG